MTKQKFISGAIEHPGSFTRYCHHHGFKGATPQCIALGKRSRNPHVVKQANLAATLRKLPRHHGPRRH